jgi:hypothetical protein
MLPIHDQKRTYDQKEVATKEKKEKKKERGKKGKG